MVEVSEGEVDRVYEKGYEDARQESQDKIATDAQYSIYQQQQQEQFNIYRLKSEDWIDKIAHDFAGEIVEIKQGEDGEPMLTGKWIRDKTKMALINTDGITLLKTTFLTYANKGSYLSFLRIEDIKRICYNLRIDLASAFAFYFRKYGVPYHMRGMVINNITNKIYIELTRAIKGREADLISKSYSHVQHEAFNTPRPGMFGKLKGWLAPRR